MNNLELVRTACSTLRVFGCAALMATSLVGCSADDSQDARSDEGVSESEPSSPSEKHMTLLARADFAGGSVRFYEPEPGTVLEVDSGKLSAEREPEPDGLGPVERYEFLTGKSAPNKLVEAAGRAVGSGQGDDGAGHQDVELSAEVPEPRKDTKSSGWDGETFFRQNYCAPTDRYWGSGPGLVYTANTSFSDRVEYLKAGAFTFSGHVNYYFGYSGGSVPDQWWGVPEGYYVGFRQTSTVNRSARSSVQNANDGPNAFGFSSFDQYVHCVNYHY